jgi:nitrite reductase/ring-hydroxylating ferredoxin subunit
VVAVHARRAGPQPLREGHPFGGIEREGRVRVVAEPVQLRTFEVRVEDGEVKVAV